MTQPFGPFTCANRKTFIAGQLIVRNSIFYLTRKVLVHIYVVLTEV